MSLKSIYDAALPQLSDAHRLYFLNKLETHFQRHRQARGRVQRRLGEYMVIAEAVARGEPVAVVWNGMDCDGVQYAGNINLVEGSTCGDLRKAIDKHIRHTYEWADGPCSYYLTSVDIADMILPSQVDLGMEAFENGHPHCIHV